MGGGGENSDVGVGSWRPDANSAGPRLRLFCLGYAGSVAESVYSRWDQLLPAAVEVYPVALPGRWACSEEIPVDDVQQLADKLVCKLPLQDGVPYAIFGTCLGGVLGYELARRLVNIPDVAPPVALFVAAASPPNLYATACRKLYINRALEEGEQPPVEEALGNCRAWEDIPKDVMLQYGYTNIGFPGAEELAASDAVYRRVVPLMAHDMGMAITYEEVPATPLTVPIIALDGTEDGTIDHGNMDQWANYTTGRFKYVPIRAAGHYFVASHTAEVLNLVTAQLLPTLVPAVMAGHSWNGVPPQAAE